MRSVLIILFASINLIYAENCDKLGVLLYEDLGCEPITSEGSPCPQKFQCKCLQKDGAKCFFKGRTYNAGDRVEDDLSYSACKVGCSCSPHTAITKNLFNCAILDCPEWLGNPVSVGCYRKYDADKCCSTGEICPPFDDIAKCEVDGKTYQEGQRFTLSDSCHSCVCQKGWKGKAEAPFCIRGPCAVQLRQSDAIFESCAPLYKGNNGLRCCPYHFYCPDGTEPIQGVAKSDETCKFGNRIMKLGQYIEKTDVTLSYGPKLEKIKCECSLPPLASCIES